LRRDCRARVISTDYPKENFFLADGTLESPVNICATSVIRALCFVSVRQDVF
jgi:hypothetical protein